MPASGEERNGWLGGAGDGRWECSEKTRGPEGNRASSDAAGLSARRDEGSLARTLGMLPWDVREAVEERNRVAVAVVVAHKQAEEVAWRQVAARREEIRSVLACAPGIPIALDVLDVDASDADGGGGKGAAARNQGAIAGIDKGNSHDRGQQGRKQGGTGGGVAVSRRDQVMAVLDEDEDEDGGEDDGSKRGGAGKREGSARPRGKRLRTLAEGAEEQQGGGQGGDGLGLMFWINADWLANWAESTEEIPPIHNAAVACEHGGVSPEKVRSVKCISAEAWTMLQSKYGTDLSLPVSDWCNACIRESLRETWEAEELQARRQELLPLVQRLLAGTPAATAAAGAASSRGDGASRGTLTGWLRGGAMQAAAAVAPPAAEAACVEVTGVSGKSPEQSGNGGNMLSNGGGAGRKGFYVSKTWLQAWTRRSSKGIAPSDAHPTRAITCPHGSLAPDNAKGAKRQAVPRAAWEHFQAAAAMARKLRAMPGGAGGGADQGAGPASGAGPDQAIAVDAEDVLESSAPGGAGGGDRGAGSGKENGWRGNGVGDGGGDDDVVVVDVGGGPFGREEGGGETRGAGGGGEGGKTGDEDGAGGEAGDGPLLEFAEDSEECAICQVAMMEEETQGSKIREEKRKEAAALSSLLTKTGAEELSGLKAGVVLRLLPRWWLDQWRAYVNAAGAAGVRPGSLELAVDGLVCPHGGMQHPLPDLVEGRKGLWRISLKEDAPAVAITENDWAELSARYGGNKGRWVQVVTSAEATGDNRPGGGVGATTAGARGTDGAAAALGSGRGEPAGQEKDSKAGGGLVLQGELAACPVCREEREDAERRARFEYTNEKIDVELTPASVVAEMAAAQRDQNGAGGAGTGGGEGMGEGKSKGKGGGDVAGDSGRSGAAGQRRSARQRNNRQSGRALRSVTVSGSDTLQHLKLLIYQAFEVPIHAQQIWRAGSMLPGDADSISLAMAGVERGDRLQLVNLLADDTSATAVVIDDDDPVAKVAAATRGTKERGFLGTSLVFSQPATSTAGHKDRPASAPTMASAETNSPGPAGPPSSPNALPASWAAGLEKAGASSQRDGNGAARDGRRGGKGLMEEEEDGEDARSGEALHGSEGNRSGGSIMASDHAHAGPARGHSESPDSVMVDSSRRSRPQEEEDDPDWVLASEQKPSPARKAHGGPALVPTAEAHTGATSRQDGVCIPRRERTATTNNNAQEAGTPVTPIQYARRAPRGANVRTAGSLPARGLGTSDENRDSDAAVAATIAMEGEGDSSFKRQKLWLQDDAELAKWACVICTFLNDELMTACEMCGKSRHDDNPVAAEDWV
eukprot:jgi/Mesvir1/17196/Mv07616-RA.1